MLIQKKALAERTFVAQHSTRVVNFLVIFEKRVNFTPPIYNIYYISVI